MNRRAISLALVVLSSLTLCAQGEGSGKVISTWGGKWDGKWAAFFIIKKDRGRLKVTYRWRESLNKDFRVRETRAIMKGRVLQVGTRIRIAVDKNDKNKALAIGDFPTERRAELTRLPNTDVGNLDEEYLEKNAGIEEPANETEDTESGYQ